MKRNLWSWPDLGKCRNMRKALVDAGGKKKRGSRGTERSQMQVQMHRKRGGGTGGWESLSGKIEKQNWK